MLMARGKTSFDDISALVKVLAPAVILAVYALAWLPGDAFYRSFNVSLEEVGLTKTRLVTRAGMYLILIVGAFAACISLVVFLDSDPSVPMRETILSAFGGEAITSVLWACLYRRKHGWVLAGAIAVAWALVASVFIAGPRLINGEMPTPGVLAALLFSLVALVASLMAYGWFLSSRVRQGFSVDGWMLPMDAHDVRVAWTNQIPPAWFDATRPYVYLGQGDQSLVLFDRVSGSTIRIPAGQAAIHSL